MSRRRRVATATASLALALVAAACDGATVGDRSTPSAVSVASSTPEPSRGPATAPPRATGEPGLAWAEFLAHLNEDRTTVAELNGALLAATDAGDLVAVRTSAVAVLDFVDAERDWLLQHPPTDCYADAHASANGMLASYGAAAERFVDWTAAGSGLAGLGALALAAEAASEASVALDSFTAVLEATTCPA